MTYKEKYMKAESLEELKKIAIEDASYIFITTDRLNAIERAMNEVIKERGWDDK